MHDTLWTEVLRRQTAMVIQKLEKQFRMTLSPIKYGSLYMEANYLFLKYM